MEQINPTPLLLPVLLSLIFLFFGNASINTDLAAFKKMDVIHAEPFKVSAVIDLHRSFLQTASACRTNSPNSSPAPAIPQDNHFYFIQNPRSDSQIMDFRECEPSSGIKPLMVVTDPKFWTLFHQSHGLFPGKAWESPGIGAAFGFQWK